MAVFLFVSSDSGLHHGRVRCGGLDRGGRRGAQGHGRRAGRWLDGALRGRWPDGALRGWGLGCYRSGFRLHLDHSDLFTTEWAFFGAVHVQWSPRSATDLRRIPYAGSTAPRPPYLSCRLSDQGSCSALTVSTLSRSRRIPSTAARAADRVEISGTCWSMAAQRRAYSS